jgi:hypothetical protein
MVIHSMTVSNENLHFYSCNIYIQNRLVVAVTLLLYSILLLTVNSEFTANTK